MIFVIDDDELMAECIANATQKDTMSFLNAIDAMSKISEGVIPNLIFLDILLDGPDGFTFLNELVSYDDTAKIPVVIVTSLKLHNRSLSAYGVIGVLDKDTMRPEDVRRYARQYAE
ncbi:response regulator [Candidatus Saccharibacteria bacterium]|nr:response regulator [Candidatus Saccharibacteria bacterium]